MHRLAVVCCLGLVACGGSAKQEPQATPVAASETAKPTQPAKASPTGDPKRAAEQLWQRRDERAALEKAIALWQSADGSPADPVLLTQLAQADYLLADVHLRDADETTAMLATFEAGVTASERALFAACPELAQAVARGQKAEEALALVTKAQLPALFWYGANLGKYTSYKGVSARLLFKDRVLAVLARAVALDPGFFHAAPHRALGWFYALAPSVAGGDMARSKTHFEKAIDLAPDYLATRVQYAELYAVKAGDRALFERLLNEVKTADPTKLPDVAPEQRLQQTRATRLLARAGELF